MSVLNLAKKYAPQFLTGVSVVGVAATGYLAARATYKSYPVLVSDKARKEKFAEVWQDYIPAAVVGGSTMATIITANHIHLQRGAALMSAYKISEEAFDRFRSAAAEELGEQTIDKIQELVVKKELDETDAEVIQTSEGETLCYDMMSGRYFKSDMESIRTAVNSLNERIINDFYASLNDFYGLLDLPSIPIGEDLGWNSDKLLQLQYTTILSKDNTPCLAIDYKVAPQLGYYHCF